MEALTGDEAGSETLVRYGLTGRVAWFASDAGPSSPGRGQAVVVRTIRGVELGEVLVAGEPSRDRAGGDSVGPFRVLRRAEGDDLERAREAERLRAPRFDLCRRVAEEEGWPLELVDVEPLLDLSTVLHVLPLGDLDPAPIRARFRVSCDFDVHVEDLSDGAQAAPAAEPAPAAGRCGDCDCGGGGCSRKAAKVRGDAPAKVASPCSSKASGAGCSSCGVAAWKSKAAVPSAGASGGLGE